MWGCNLKAVVLLVQQVEQRLVIKLNRMENTLMTLQDTINALKQSVIDENTTIDQLKQLVADLGTSTTTEIETVEAKIAELVAQQGINPADMQFINDTLAAIKQKSADAVAALTATKQQLDDETAKETDPPVQPPPPAA